MRIGIAFGYWSQNIGNAFFNLGAFAQIRRAFPGAEILMLPDSPGHWTMKSKKVGKPKGCFSFIPRVDCDLVLLLGPQLSFDISLCWKEDLTQLREATGAKVGLLGTGFMRYTAEEEDAVRDFLSLGLVDFAISRDRTTYAKIRDLVPTFDGIDSAFFLDDAYKPVDLKGDYVVVNYDRYPEPSFQTNERTPDVTFRESPVGLTYPKTPTRISELGHSASYLSSFVDRRKAPDSLAGVPICRTEHRTNPPVWRKVYGRPGGFAADEPLSYLAIYRSASAVFTDRVHTTVASLVYGTPVHFYGGTQRGSLLGRAGAVTSGDGFLALDRTELARSKTAQVRALRELAGAE